MAYLIIRFTKKEDSTKEYVTYIQGIYEDIVSNRIKKSYEVCMGGPFLRSTAERIIRQLKEALIETGNKYVDVHPEGIVIAAGSYDVNDPSFVEVTYHLKHS